jgi:hypothetical protein
MNADRAEAMAPPPGQLFTQDALVKGRPSTLSCVRLAGHTFVIESGPLTVVRLQDEWFEDLAQPQAALDALQASNIKADLFTFWQRMPNVEPAHPYALEWQEIAALPVTTHEHWLKNQIRPRVRSQIRKAHKDGLTVKEVPYDDEFVRGMTAIFNESPVRQGRPFWHYGKDFETVKQQFSRYLFREWMIGAYHEDRLVGFMMLANAGRFALTGQIIASLHHRDLSPNNALISKAVETCEARGLAHLIYLFWSDDSLGEFKRRCGFEKVRMPRYCVPLTWKGRLALKTGLHHGWKAMLPAGMLRSLKQARSAWHERQSS